jgi:hypothetical protein
VRRGCQQAEGTGARNGLGAPVCAELGVQVAQVGADGVVRDVQLARDLRRGQVGRQVAEHVQLAVAQRLPRRLRVGGRWGGPVSREQAEDVGDQGGVRGALPGLALEQARRRVQQEHDQDAVGSGHVERALQGAPGGGRVAERVAGDRLQQEGLTQRGRPAYRRGAVENRRNSRDRCARVALRQPQRRQADAHLPQVAVLVAECGQGLLGALGLPEADQGLHQK